MKVGLNIIYQGQTTIPVVTRCACEVLCEFDVTVHDGDTTIGHPQSHGRFSYGFVQVPSLYCQQLTPPWCEQAPLPVALLVVPSLHTAPIL
jgi:hypothetical protein